jgi:hypothetical protein
MQWDRGNEKVKVENLRILKVHREEHSKVIPGHPRILRNRSAAIESSRGWRY